VGSENGHTDIVKLLLEVGADKDARNMVREVIALSQVNVIRV